MRVSRADDAVASGLGLVGGVVGDDGLLGGGLSGRAFLGRLGTGVDDVLGGSLLDGSLLDGAAALAAGFAEAAFFAFGFTGSSTSSMTAMGALSPLRLPILVMRV